MFPDRGDRTDETPESSAAAVVSSRCPLPPSSSATAAGTASSTAGGPAAAAAGGQPPCAGSDMSRICITVAPFTGGPFEVAVNKGDTIEELKKLIARRLKVSKERIYLLYRER